MAARWAHTPEVPGSIPGLATNSLLRIEMIKTEQQANAVQERRKQAGKRGLAKAVKRFLKRKQTKK